MNKRKNFKKDRTFLNDVKFVDTKNQIGIKSTTEVLKELAGTLIFDSAKMTINDVPILELERKLKEHQKIPNGYRAACHRHEKTIYFKTLKELIEHCEKNHDYRKG